MDLKSIYIRLLPLNRLLVLLLLGSFVIISCSSKGDEPPMVELDDFLSKKESGLYGYGGYLLRYNEQKFQISINEKRRQVRMQSDDQSAYFNVIFAVMPAGVNDVVSVDFSYKGGGDELTCKMEMTLCKVTANNLWLWNHERELGLIIPIF